MNGIEDDNINEKEVSSINDSCNKKENVQVDDNEE